MEKKMDWEEVESKISLICYKFDNLRPWHDDLAQELRIHAYYVSDNYYDLYRKAIDFWRKIQTRQSPETPYFDLEVLNPSYEEKYDDNFDDLVSLIREELNRPGNNAWENKYSEIASRLLEFMIEDIDPKKEAHKVTSQLNIYMNKRLNLSWAAEETGIGYKRLMSAMKLLEDIVRGLAAMHKIELPDEYFKGYFDR